MKTLLKIIIVLPLLFYYSTCSAAETIYVSQVQITGGTGKTDHDFVELFNPGVVPVNLKGYRLVKRSVNGNADTSLKSWTADAFIPAHGFYLWANSNFTDIVKVPDVTTSGTLSNDNGIALRMGASDSGTVVDSIAWGATTNIFRNVSLVNPIAGQSLVRQSLYQDTAPFIVQTAEPRNSTVTDGPPIVPPEPIIPESPASTTTETSTGKEYLQKSNTIIISEIFPNPVGEDSGKEVIELQNIGDNPVSLDGWLLADNQEGSSVNANAFTIHGESILPGAFAIINIPTGYFSLNNNNGDTVNLYFGDKTSADSKAYMDDPEEGMSYQKIGDSWVWAPPSLGQPNFGDSLQLANNFKVYVNEIMPNPAGEDEGKEWLEIYNISSDTVNLNGFFLDGPGRSVDPSPNAWKLDESVVVASGSFITLTVPEDAFVMLNSGGVIRFFNSEKNQIGLVVYGDAPEGRSFSRLDDSGTWGFGDSTPGEANIIATGTSVSVTLSEIYPNPADDEEEFLEIKNSGLNEINLKNWGITIGDKTQKIKNGNIIEPGGLFVFTQDDLTAQLRNTGQQVSLISPSGKITSLVNYPKAEKGFSYIRLAQDSWVWTEHPTRGNENVAVLAAEVAVSQPEGKPKTAKTSAKASVAKTDKSDNVLQHLQEEVGKLEAVIGQLEGTISEVVLSTAKASEDINYATPEDKRNLNFTRISALGIILTALALLVFIIKMFFKGNEISSVK